MRMPYSSDTTTSAEFGQRASSGSPKGSSIRDPRGLSTNTAMSRVPKITSCLNSRSGTSEATAHRSVTGVGARSDHGMVWEGQPNSSPGGISSGIASFWTTAIVGLRLPRSMSLT